MEHSYRRLGLPPFINARRKYHQSDCKETEHLFQYCNRCSMFQFWIAARFLFAAISFLINGHSSWFRNRLNQPCRSMLPTAIRVRQVMYSYWVNNTSARQYKTNPRMHRGVICRLLRGTLPRHWLNSIQLRSANSVLSYHPVIIMPLLPQPMQIMCMINTLIKHHMEPDAEHPVPCVLCIADYDLIADPLVYCSYRRCWGRYAGNLNKQLY